MLTITSHYLSLLLFFVLILRFSFSFMSNINLAIYCHQTPYLLLMIVCTHIVRFISYHDHISFHRSLTILNLETPLAV